MSTSPGCSRTPCLGCAFYGAFVTKMLVLRSNRVPRWALPLIGGLLFAVLAGVRLTSSLWFFATDPPTY